MYQSWPGGYQPPSGDPAGCWVLSQWVKSPKRLGPAIALLSGQFSRRRDHAPTPVWRRLEVAAAKVVLQMRSRLRLRWGDGLLFVAEDGLHSRQEPENLGGLLVH